MLRSGSFYSPDSAPILGPQRAAARLQAATRRRLTLLRLAAKAERYEGYLDLLRSAGRVAPAAGVCRVWGRRPEAAAEPAGAAEVLAVVRVVEKLAVRLSTLDADAQVSAALVARLMQRVLIAMRRHLSEMRRHAEAESSVGATAQSSSPRALSGPSAAPSAAPTAPSPTPLDAPRDADGSEVGSLEAIGRGAGGSAERELFTAREALAEAEGAASRLRADLDHANARAAAASERAESLEGALAAKDAELHKARAAHTKAVRKLRSELDQARSCHPGSRRDRWAANPAMIPFSTANAFATTRR